MKLLLLLFAIITIVAPLGCELCIQLTQLLQDSILKIVPQSLVQQAVYLVCERKYDSEKLCQQVSQQLTPLAMKSGVKGILKQGRICENFCGKDFYSTFDLKNIQQSIENLPTIDLENQKYSFEKIVLEKTQISNLKILHLTDVHLDLNYTEKTSTVCQMPICCHIEDGYPETESTKAKPFGSIKCDTPIKLLDKALDYIHQNIPEIDIVIVTGDYSAHNQWQKTPESVKYVRNLVEQKIRQKVNTKYIITAPGNNEYLPDHQVDPSSVPDESIRVFRVYQPDQQNYMTFVSINTLFCDNLNLYLVQDQTGPLRQLKMLQKIIQQNENIYLIGHIGLSTSSCAETYSLIFRTILNKYKNKVRGQFYGHTHLDQFMINTNPKNISEITSFSLLGGSLSPFGTGTSRFRIIDLNEESFNIQNYLDYELKLNEENFGLNYEFKKYYGINDSQITPEVMRSFQERLQKDQSLRKRYAAELNGRQTGNSPQAYCQTYDNQTAIQACLNNHLTFSMQINKYLELIQGPWGSYGQMIQ